jgi:hypothetical protein
MEILLSPVVGLLMLFISRCPIKTGCYCQFSGAVKPLFWELGKLLDQRMMDAIKQCITSNVGLKLFLE